MIKRIDSPKVDIYLNGELAYKNVNEYELNYLRWQIVKNKAEGYSLKTPNGEESIIKPNGDLENWPHYLDLQMRLLSNVMKEKYYGNGLKRRSSLDLWVKKPSKIEVKGFTLKDTDNLLGDWDKNVESLRIYGVNTGYYYEFFLQVKFTHIEHQEYSQFFIPSKEALDDEGNIKKGLIIEELPGALEDATSLGMFLSGEAAHPALFYKLTSEWFNKYEKNEN